MRTVHKFKLTTMTTELPLSPQHQVVFVAEQGEEVTIWIELYTDEGDHHPYRFYLVPTGAEVDQKEETKHVGSCVVSKEVWHVYEGMPS